MLGLQEVVERAWVCRVRPPARPRGDSFRCRSGLDPLLFTVVSLFPVSEGSPWILTCLDRREHVSETREVVDAKCRRDVEVTRLNRDTVQHRSHGTCDHVLDLRFAE